MAQYLNPYEGIGNALINIGQNYDLDRRRKREAEEDQKRRRADYLWQSKQEEERANREYERSKPDRELAMRIKLAELSKKQADAVTATLPRITNLPGAGGSYVDEFVKDDEGNITGVTRRHESYKPIPREPKSVNWKTLYDKDGNAILVDPDNPGNRVVTDLRGTTPPITGLSIKDLQAREDRKFSELNKVDAMTNEQVAEQFGIDTAQPQPAINAAVAAKKKELKDRINAHYSQQVSNPAANGPSWPEALMSFGQSVGQGLSNMGVRAGEFSAEEAAIFDQMNSGKLSQEDGAKKLAEITGSPVSVGEGKGAATAPAPKNKTKEEPEMSYSAAAAMVKAKRPDLTDEQIARYLKSKGITPPKQKKN